MLDGLLYQSQGQSLQLPPSLRFPPLREGNRVGRVGSVPPACRGNLKEGVIGHTRFCELWLRDWYYYALSMGLSLDMQRTPPMAFPTSPLLLLRVSPVCFGGKSSV